MSAEQMTLLQNALIQFAGALVIIVIGFFVANKIAQMVAKMLDKNPKLDVSLKKFLVSMVAPVLKVIVIIMALEQIGADTAPFVAVLGAASFAVGLAFQGTLANFAGGVLLLVLRPFTVGDFVEVSGGMGTLEEVGIIYTKILTVDNKTVTIPNGALSNANIVNYTRENLRRVDLTFGASYDAPVDKVKAAIEEVIKSHDKIIDDKPYFVRLGNQGASSLDYTVRVWTHTADYWDVHFDLIEAVTKKFQAEGISIPYNILDVNLNQNPQ